MNETAQATTAVATTENGKPLSLQAQVEQKTSHFRASLPAHIPVERFSRVVMLAVQRDPKLGTANRASLWNACIQAATDGLLPDGREGALVIYSTKVKNPETGVEEWINKVQWMPMIAGIRKKVRNSGEIKDWYAQVVYEKDEWDYQLGDDPHIHHKPFLGGDPGQVVAAYSVAIFKTGEKSREVMTRAEIEKVRNVSKSKDKAGSPWMTWYSEMCRKVVARRHAKMLPMSTDLDDLIRRDDVLYDLEGKSDKNAPRLAPPKDLNARLDALISDGREDIPDHDEETGEVIEHSVARDETAPKETPKETVKDPAKDKAAPKETAPAKNGNGAKTQAAAAPTDKPKEAAVERPQDWWLGEGDNAAERGTPVLDAFLANAKPPKPFTEKGLARWRREATAADDQIAREEGGESDAQEHGED